MLRERFGGNVRRQCADVISDLSADCFFREYCGTQPVVFHGGVAHWPAVQKWTPDYLRLNYGDGLVTLEFYDPENRELTFADQTLIYIRKMMALRDYWVSSEYSDRRYAIREDADLFEEYPELFADLLYFSPFASFGSMSDGRYKSLWIGPAGYITGLHTDPGDTLLFQIRGKKSIVLFHPDQTPFLYEETEQELDRKFDDAGQQAGISYAEWKVLKEKVRWSKVEPFSWDSERFPLYQKAECTEAQIAAGDVLYIPDQWWHGVRALDPCISVSIDPDYTGSFFGDGRRVTDT